MCYLALIRDSVMLYPTERDLMSDHDATQPPASRSPRSGEGDEFNARTVLINQDMLDAARAESRQATGQHPGGQMPGPASTAVPGAQPQPGSWRPAQSDLPSGPPPEQQTRAYPTGAGQEATQPGGAPADPYLQAGPFVQQGEFGPSGQQSQPTQFGRPDQGAGAGIGGSGASPFQAGQSASPSAQPGWGTPHSDGTAAAASPLGQSAPGVPSAPGAPAEPAAGGALGAAASPEALYWQQQAQPAVPQQPQAFAQQPAPHSHPFSGGRETGEVGMSSVFPTATARAEAEQAASGDFVPGMPQPVAQSAPSSAPSVQSQGPVPPWGSVPSSDVAAGQAPPLSDMAPPTFGRPGGGDAMASVKTGPESADSVGSWVLALFLFFIPIVNIVYLLMLAFGSGGSATKKNWAKAGLIWLAIGLVLSVIAYSLLGVGLWATFSTAG